MSEERQDGVNPDLFLALRRHLKIVHHIPGRIRLRVGVSVFKELGDLDGKVFDRILGAIAGISDVRVNAMAGSVVISYLPKELKSSWWETLINGEDSRATALLDRLLVGELAPAVEAVRRDD